MARPKKIEGGATTQPVIRADASSAPITQAEGAPTAPEAPVVEETTQVTPVDTTSADLPTEAAVEPVVPTSPPVEGTTPDDGTVTEGVASAQAEPSPVTTTPIPDGLGPAEMSLEDLDALGIPRPGTVLTCASFENGEAVTATVLKLSDDLNVALVLIDGLGWRWPVPTGRIEGTTWLHDATDYPPPGKVPAFDAEARRAPTDAPVVEPDSERPALVAVEMSAADLLRERYAGALRTFYGKPPAEVTDEQVAAFAAKMDEAIEPAALPTEVAAPPPRVATPAMVALGIDTNYVLCRIHGLGSIAGHGLRESDGAPMEFHRGGTRAYFTTATVKKLADLLTVLDES